MKRALFISLVVLCVLVGAGGLVYAFGTPQAPDAAAPVAASGEAAPPVAASGGPVPEPDPSAPLAIEIPGCVCHSDDPAEVERHAQYRMNQCAGCHAGKTPTGR